MKVGIYLLYILHSTTVHLLQTSCRLPRGWPVGAKRELSELPAMNSRPTHSRRITVHDARDEKRAVESRKRESCSCAA